ncbi:MAG: hypothetical protein JXR46_16585 [Calditrichaceae bacterium]|nr:hypothetical protein [Calditrichaceae bacterium]RQV96672.1 MAG: hypothetical protein EH224_03730 [Calditrichota bacterium]
MKRLLFIPMLFITAVSCTQIVDEDKIGENAYTGDDGCIYCHTSKERLTVLAVGTGDTGGGGGG